MNNKDINLSRKVNSEIFQVKAQIAKYENKQFFQAIIELIYEESLSGNTSYSLIKKLISQNLIFRPESPIFAERLLIRLNELNCFQVENENLVLTSIGEELRIKGHISIPQEDVFDITCILEDKLIPPYICNLKKIKISAENKNTLVATVLNMREFINDKKQDSSKGKKKSSSKLMNDFTRNYISIPNQLFSLKDLSFNLFDGSQVILTDLDKKGKSVSSNQNLQLKLRISKTANSQLDLVQGKNILNLNSVLIEYPQLNYQNIMEQLINQTGFEYDTTYEAVLIDITQFNELLLKSPSSLIGFQKDFTIPNPTISHLDRLIGSFETTTLNAVKIRPNGPECANLWSRYLLKEGINHYVDENQYQSICDGITLHDVLVDYQIIFPNWFKVINSLNIKFGSTKYWYLQAHRDLTTEVLR